MPAHHPSRPVHEVSPTGWAGHSQKKSRKHIDITGKLCIICTMVMKTVQTKRGLQVQNVPLMSTVAPGAKDGAPDGITIENLAAFVASYEKFSAQGKFPRFTLGHNHEDLEAPVAGRISKLRLEGEWLFGDVLITDEAAKEQYLAGNIPSLSPEVYLHPEPLLWSVAATKGQRAHFENKPDFQPEDFTEFLVSLSGSKPIFCDAVSFAMEDSEGNMENEEMTLEELAMRVAKLEESIAEIKSEPKPEDKDENDSQTQSKMADKDEEKSKDDKPGPEDDKGKDDKDDKGDEDEDDDKKASFLAELAAVKFDGQKTNAKLTLATAGVEFDAKEIDAAKDSESLNAAVLKFKKASVSKEDDAPGTETSGMSKHDQIKFAIKETKRKLGVNHDRACKIVQGECPELFSNLAVKG